MDGRAIHSDRKYQRRTTLGMKAINFNFEQVEMEIRVGLLGGVSRKR